jgi:LemA protein
MPVIIVLVVLVLIVMWVISLYNGLVRLRNRRQNAFADIDVQLRQRHDLVPQLVETVKGYAGHEKELLIKITEARTAAMSATSIDGKIAAEQQLSSALAGLKVQVEAYPDLKANQNFLQLQEELSDIENKLAASRRFFNGATTEYNNAVESFPGNLVARNFGFAKEIMFDLGTDTRKQMEEPPKIQF